MPELACVRKCTRFEGFSAFLETFRSTFPLLNGIDHVNRPYLTVTPGTVEYEHYGRNNLDLKVFPDLTVEWRAAACRPDLWPLGCNIPVQSHGSFEASARILSLEISFGFTTACWASARVTADAWPSKSDKNS